MDFKKSQLNRVSFFGFFAIIFVIVFSLNWVLQNFCGQDTFWTSAYRTLLSDEPKIVFVGSSRFYTGINPNMFSKPIVILGLPYNDSETQFRIVNDNIRSIQKAGVVVFDLSQEALFMTAFQSAKGQFYRAADLGVSFSVWERLKLNSYQLTVDVLFPAIQKMRFSPKEFSDYLERLKETSPHPDHQHLIRYGFFPGGMPLFEERAQSESIKAFNFISKQYDIERLRRRSEELLRESDKLSQLGVKVVFLILPALSHYKKLQDATWTPDFNLFLETLKNKYSVLDYRESLQNDEYFRDSTHFRLVGSQAISQQINKDLMEILAKDSF